MDAVDTGVRVERRGGVLWLRLHRPESRNALTLGDMHALATALRDVDAGEDRCAVITGHEPGTFCSGFRLDEGAAGDMASGRAKQAADDLFALLPVAPIPVIAVVDGPARGAGCELALRCDLRIASDRASFGIPAARLGVPYTPPSIAFLVRRYGQGPVAQLFYAASILDGDAALRSGLVHELVGARKLPSRVAELTERIAASAPLVQRFFKAAVAAAEGVGEEAAIDAALARVTASEDFAETLRAIGERREPRFTGG
ncbi:MAG TPA: enoyl-CoA hydratase/isomerase family protein [Candidatus Dormibacteraeota bacterium]|jgi:enoyl-CoA hydratase/carnithine racemase|nr:enoyl-CoA hydratase/isomerase family protein [Candidatus Dormibacteraeota bacterium]